MSRSDIRPLTERFELQPDSRFNDPFPAGERPKTAVGACNHAFAIANRGNSFLYPPRDNLRVFHDVACCFDATGQQDHVVW